MTFRYLEMLVKNYRFHFLGINIIPSSDELPFFNPTIKSIFYGLTTFTRLAYSKDNAALLSYA